MGEEFFFQKDEEKIDIARMWVEEEEDLYEKKEVKEERIPLVIFRLAREWYGIEISMVKEIIKVGTITYLPSSPEYISGIVNYRGNILSVTNVRKVLGLPPEESDERSRIIVIESNMVNTGFLVDEVVESADVPKSRVGLPLPTIPPEGAKYIKGQFKWEDKLVAILHGERILDIGT